MSHVKSLDDLLEGLRINLEEQRHSPLMIATSQNAPMAKGNYIERIWIL